MEYLGQHFLKNPLVTQKILETLNPQKGECVIEIGPGKGALTRPLFALCRTRGATYYGIEKDTSLIPTLVSEVPELQGLITEGDALRELPTLCARLERERIPYRIVGNIPYYITGFLLRTVSELPYKPISVVLLIQNEVADRLRATQGATNLLSASVQVWAETRKICVVPAKDFDPPPQVTSAVIEIKTRPEVKHPDSLAGYYRMLKVCFKQPRKTLLNNLVEGGIEKSVAVAALTKLSLSDKARPQDLTPASIEQLAKELY